MCDNENGSKHDVFEIKVCFVMLILRNGMFLFLNYIESSPSSHCDIFVIYFLMLGSFFFLIHWIRLNDHTMVCLID